MAERNDPTPSAGRASDDCILIVDDDLDVRGAMHSFVERAGFQTLSVGSAEEAIALLKEREVDIVITDIILNGLNGLELTDRIKSDHDVDVIVMTGYSGEYSYEEAVNKGASDFVFKPVRFEELLLRIRRVLRERQLTRERSLMLGKLQNLAITDGLTKLYNSRHFYKQLDMEVGRSNRYDHPLALLMMDIDHFKRYNDTYGHVEGDKVLTRIARVIKSCLRTMDSAYRYGGEEFTALLPETRADEAKTVAERLRTAVKVETFSPQPDEEVGVTISLGVTEYLLNESKSEFVQRADRALYQSKDAGRDRVSVLYPETSS
ncbi:MAG: diguanylate cyclase [Desulfobacteraceae bacterium]|nr:diguanylate cyclase [Desulfobacteraceae bacterium]